MDFVFYWIKAINVTFHRSALLWALHETRVSGGVSANTDEYDLGGRHHGSFDPGVWRAAAEQPIVAVLSSHIKYVTESLKFI